MQRHSFRVEKIAKKVKYFLTFVTAKETMVRKKWVDLAKLISDRINKFDFIFFFMRCPQFRTPLSVFRPILR